MLTWTHELLFTQNAQRGVELTSESFGKNLKLVKHFLDLSTGVPGSSCHSLPQTWDQLSFRGGGPPWRAMVFRNQTPGAGCAHCRRERAARSVSTGPSVDSAAVVSCFVGVVP